MGKVLLIGGIGAGKTSLKQKLMNEHLSYRKTQMLDFSQLFIDCPGEYLEIPRFYHYDDAQLNGTRVGFLETHDCRRVSKYRFPIRSGHYAICGCVA